MVSTRATHNSQGSLDDLFLHLALFNWREEQEMGRKIPFSSEQHLLRIIPWCLEMSLRGALFFFQESITSFYNCHDLFITILPFLIYIFFSIYSWVCTFFFKNFFFFFPQYYYYYFRHGDLESDTIILIVVVSILGVHEWWISRIWRPTMRWEA